MKIPKRSRPMVFEIAEEELAASLVSEPEAVDGLGFRPLGAASADRPIAVHGAGRSMTSIEQDAEAYGLGSAEEAQPAPGWPVWLAATAASALWALAPIAFAIGYRNGVSPLQNDQFAMAVFALLAIGPAAFVFCAAYVIRQGQKLAFEARRSKIMAEEMVAPALVAAARAGQLAQLVRDEINRAGMAADEAREALVALRDVMAFETDKLTGATAQSVRTARELAETLGRERGEMSNLAQTLDVQAARVADAIGQQAKMVAEAAGVAETQIREAEVGLSSRAADLAAAASAAGDAARTAGDDMNRHIARLEVAGAGVAEQVGAVESGLSEHRLALVALSQSLKTDQSLFAADASTHAEKLGDLIAAARGSALEMEEHAGAGGEAVAQLVELASLQLRDLVETAKAERAEFGQATLHSLEAVSRAAALEREQLETDTRSALDALATAAEENRKAAASHTTAAREQIEQLSEAAFSAGQKANQTFEARLDEARALVEASSKMVVDVGELSAAKLEAGTAAARETIEELTAMMAELEVRASRLPEVARGQIADVRAAVAQGLEDLVDHSRRAAEETWALDEANRARVSTTASLTQDTGAGAALALRSSGPPPGKSDLYSSIASADVRSLWKSEESTAGTARPEVPAQPDLETGSALADRIGLRQRIRLTPTATDAEFSAVFESAGGASPSAIPGEEGNIGEEERAWTWKDLLASLDDSSGDHEGLEVELAAELARMGVEPDKLLPQARVQEVTAALQTGDIDGSRQVIRRLAPAATRRIVRRMFTDEDVKRRTVVFVSHYKTLVDDAIARDTEGRRLEMLLCSDAGLMFLLLDAAAGDII